MSKNINQRRREAIQEVEKRVNELYDNLHKELVRMSSNDLSTPEGASGLTLVVHTLDDVNEIRSTLRRFKVQS